MEKWWCSFCRGFLSFWLDSVVFGVSFVTLGSSSVHLLAGTTVFWCVSSLCFSLPFETVHDVIRIMTYYGWYGFDPSSCTACFDMWNVLLMSSLSYAISIPRCDDFIRCAFLCDAHQVQSVSISGYLCTAFMTPQQHY
eukprot:369526_1